MRHSTLCSCVCIFLLHVSFCWAEPFSVHENEVSFDLYGGYLVVVRGSLGKLEKRNFIIDSGTNPSVLDERVARHLGLSGRKEKLRLVNREIDTTIVLIPSIRLGPLAQESMPMLVQDLSFFQRKLGVRIDARVKCHCPAALPTPSCTSLPPHTSCSYSLAAVAERSPTQRRSGGGATSPALTS